MYRRCVSALYTALLVSAVAADTSLWIPDTDPQPISAGILGVGADGRTTWELQQGSATGTQTDPDDLGFPFTATLIEGPSDAVLSFAETAPPNEASAGPVALAAGISCSISGSLAVCVNVASEAGVVSTETDMETVSAFVVQGGGSVSGAPSSSGGSATQTASGNPTQSVGTSQASAGSSPAPAGAQPTGKGNAAQRYHITGGLIGLATAVGGTFMYAV